MRSRPRHGTGLGVEIVAVGVEGMHPPVEPGVPEAFHAVIDAQTEVETNRLQAEQAEADDPRHAPGARRRSSS